MNRIWFYGLILNVYIENENVVVDVSGKEMIPIQFSVQKVIGADKYVDKKEIVISSDVIKLIIRNDFNTGLATVHVKLNV